MRTNWPNKSKVAHKPEVAQKSEVAQKPEVAQTPEVALSDCKSLFLSAKMALHIGSGGLSLRPRVSEGLARLQSYEI